MNSQFIVFMAAAAFTAAGLSWFLICFYREPRSLWLGLSFLVAVLGLMSLIALTLVMLDTGLANMMVISGVMLAVFSLMLLPVAVVFSLITSGARLIRREGFSLSHALSLGLGVLYMLYLLFWPMLGAGIQSVFLDFLYDFLSYCFMATAAVFVVYWVTNLLNLLPRRRTYRYIIVLGSGLRRDGTLTPLLAGRVDKGIESYRNNPGSLLIMSGGQGPDEVIPEAEAMRGYAQSLGIPGEDIFAEAGSTNTHENLMFSKQLIEKSGRGEGRILLVTTRYHVLRALLLAKSLDIPCDGRGSKTRMYFSINAFVREWIAYLVLYRKSYLILLLIGLAATVAAYLYRPPV